MMAVQSGLEEVLKCSFGSVANMLAGKCFPQNVRALRLVVGELLREFLVMTDCYSDLMEALGDAATQSKTTEMWVENLVKPVFIIIFFVRAERELAIAPVGCQKDATLLLSGKSHQLC